MRFSGKTDCRLSCKNPDEMLCVFLFYDIITLSVKQVSDTGAGIVLWTVVCRYMFNGIVMAAVLLLFGKMKAGLGPLK